MIIHRRQYLRSRQQTQLESKCHRDLSVCTSNNHDQLQSPLIDVE